MKAWGALAILVCAMPALTLPAGAAAKPGYEVRPASAQLDLFLGERDGFAYSVSAGDGQQVQLLVERELFSAVVYSVKGRVSSSRIEADFGELGRIDVRVKLAGSRSKRSRERNGRCRRRAPLFLRGSYRGAIEFTGEGAVPGISSKRGDLRFTRRFRGICKLRSPKESDLPRGLRIDVGALRAHAESEGRTTAFEAFSAAPRDGAALSIGLLLALTTERRDRVRISRLGLEIFSLGIVMSRRGKDPLTVRIKAEEAPFAGRALYSRSSGSGATWTGNLSARLPGAGRVPLTGPGFSVDFCRRTSFEAVEDCLARSGSPPPALARQFRLEAEGDPGSQALLGAYGSGSHSQPLALARLSSLR